MTKHKLLINGEWVEPASNDWFESFNPYTAEPWALIPRGTAADVDRAVAAARDAYYGDWRKLTATARGAMLRKLADLIAAQANDLAEIETMDNGKLIAEMRGQLNYIPQWFNYFGGLADKIEGRVIPIDKPGVFNFTREEPLGVIAAVTPWNSPLMLACWKLAPALAAGNTVVWKPSEYSSVSALVFGELFAKAGFPPGVVNIVTGFGHEVGEPLITHRHVAKIAFTGGDATGERVYGLAAKGIRDTGAPKVTLASNRNGPVVTAGGLVFVGTWSDRTVRAFDKTSGKVLWEQELEANPEGLAAVYEAGGRQYVVFCGAARPPESAPGEGFAWKAGKPEKQGYYVFALPKK